MKARTRIILEKAIERGIERGHLRAHKHTNSPSLDALFADISDCIMYEIDTYFTFEEGESHGTSF